MIRIPPTRIQCVRIPSRKKILMKMTMLILTKNMIEDLEQEHQAVMLVKENDDNASDDEK
jgi:hypothetical protein